jgi:hypothetical protein
MVNAEMGVRVTSEAHGVGEALEARREQLKRELKSLFREE